MVGKQGGYGQGGCGLGGIMLPLGHQANKIMHWLIEREQLLTVSINSISIWGFKLSSPLKSAIPQSCVFVKQKIDHYVREKVDHLKQKNNRVYSQVDSRRLFRVCLSR